VAFPHPPPGARAGLDAVCARDPDLAGIEAAAGPLPWRSRPAGFAGLLQAIVGQQISNQAAAAIWRRTLAVPGALIPGTFSDVPDEALRGAGFSRPKILHARALAAAFADGRLGEAQLAALDDEAAVAAIAAVRGMGRWSAEVYLLFALARDDVFPAGDLALQAAAAALKRLPERPGPEALLALAEPWRPWRGLAARLLWHHWRHLTGRPAMDDLSPQAMDVERA
jgi:DNA-3-methyladenine glycosylase II